MNRYIYPLFYKSFGLLLVVVFLFSLPFEIAHAAQIPPQILTYQGRLTDSGGNLLGGSGTTYYFKFSIWTTSDITTGTQLWPAPADPTYVGATVSQGVFTINIGDTANGYPYPLDLNFSNNTNIYLQVRASSSSGSGYETLSPRQQITSAAFAQLSGAVVGTTTPSTFGTTTPATNSFVTIAATSTNSIPLSIVGFTNQVANLFQIQNAANTNLFSVNAAGGVTAVEATTTSFFSTTASSTNLFTSNLSVGSLSGFLKATAGAVATALVNLASDVTGVLPVGNGGTGWASIASGVIPYGNEAGSLATTTAGTAGDVLALLSGIPTWTASSTLSTISGTLTETKGGTNQTGYTTGDILYAISSNTLAKLGIGSAGQVLKVSGGVPIWGADLSGSGGSGAFATTSDDLAVYPSTPGYVVILGASATTTTGNILEVLGNSLFRGSMTAYNTITAPSFNATTTATSTFVNLSALGNASTSNLTASNSFTFSNVTGFLKAVGGVVSTALVDLAANVTGILPVANGGTGWAAIQSGAIPYGNDSSVLATTTAGTPGNILALLSGIPTWTSTTTMNIGGSAATVTTAPALSGAVTSNGSTNTTAFGSQSAGVLGSAITGIPSMQATSTLYGTGVGGQVLGWNNTANGLAFIATSTNALTATALQNARTINGVSFDGTANITIASTTLLADTNTWTNTQTMSISGNAATVTNGVYTTTFNNLFDNRLSATTSVAGITTLPNLSLPYAQVSGTPTSLATSTLLADSNTFSGVNFFTNASSDWSGTWQTHAPAYFQTALGFTPYNSTNPSSYIALTALSGTFPIIDTSGVFSFGGLSTSSPISAASGFLYATGVNTIASVSTSSPISMSISGNATTVTNGVYTTTFNNLFDNRLSATTSVAGITTLPNLSLPYAQVSGTPTSLATSTLLADTNTWSGNNTFSNAPTFATFSGLIAGNSGVSYAISTTSLNASISGNAATVTTNANMSGAVTSSDSNVTAFGTLAQGILGNPFPTATIPTPLATSTLYGVSTGGMVLGWDNTASGIRWIATSTGAGGGVTSLAATYPLLTDGATGAITISSALATTSANTWASTQTFSTASTTNLIVSSAGGSGTRCLQVAADGTISATAGACGVAGAGIQNIGPAGQLQTGTTQTLATSTADTNLGMTIVGSSDIQTFTPYWIGQLAISRGGTGLSSIAGNRMLYSNSAGTALLEIATSSLSIGGSAATVTTAPALSGAVTSNGSTNTTAFGSQSAGVLGSAIIGIPSMQATSTLYGTGVGGQVLGWNNTTGGLAFIATSTSVSSISIASANGFAGSSSGGATPALTISTSITGLLKGNGTAISAAANGTDYTLITANTCGAGNHVSAITAEGVITCSADTGGTFAWTPTSWGNATSTTLGFLNGFLSTASSTINSTLTLTPLGTPAGTFLAVDATGLVIATTSPTGGSGISTSLTKGWTIVGDDAGTAQATSTIFISSIGQVGIGTTSPYSLLSISNNLNTAADTSLFTIASTTGGIATSTLFTILANGNVGVGVGTTSPNVAFTINASSTIATGSSYGQYIKFIDNNSAATANSYGLYVDNRGGRTAGNHFGVYAISDAAVKTNPIGSLAFTDRGAGKEYGVWGTGGNYGVYGSNGNGVYGVAAQYTGTSGGGGALYGLSTTITSDKLLTLFQSGSAMTGDAIALDMASGSGTFTGNFISANNSGANKFVVDYMGNIGTGTSTPRWQIQSASSTAPQLALSDGSNTSNHWTFRNAGGYLYIATSSPSTFATSTMSALTIDSNGIPTFASLGGAIGCAQFDATGKMSNTGTACGSGGGAFSWTPTSWGNSTSTTLGFLNGFLSTASSTINSTLTLTPLGTPAGTFLAVDATGLVIATTTPSGSGISTSLTKGWTIVGDDAGTAQATSTIFISSIGQVGIGTTSPYSLLSISNNLNTAADTPLFTIASTTGGIATSTLFTILANGNVGVGVGTTSPNVAFTINASSTIATGNAYGQYIRFIDNNSANTANSYGLYSDNSGGLSLGNHYGVYGRVNRNSAQGALGFSDRNAGFDYGVWGSSASIGVLGTASGDGTGVKATYTGTSGGGNALDVNSQTITSDNLVKLSHANTTMTGTMLNILGANTSGIFTGNFINAKNGTLSRFTINSTGATSIGTTSPWAMLAVQGGFGSTLPLFDISSSTAENGTATSSLFRITYDGNVGIGTTSPFALLSIATPNGATGSLSTLFAIASSTATATTTLFSIDNTGLTTIGSSSGTGDANFQFASDSNAWDIGYNSTDKSFNIASSTSFSSNVAFTILKTNLNVGIGTTTPYAKLSLVDTTAGLHDVFAISSSTSGLIFKVDSYGQAFADGGLAATGADYAEYFYTNSVNLKSGEVVCVDVLNNNAVKRCERGADNNVMGIVSTKPSVVGNTIKEIRTNPSHYAIIGMMGQVDAYVSAENGPINVGDSLTSASSTPGYAMRADGGDSTVGIALEPLVTGTSKIKVLISRRNKSLAVEEVESLVVERIANMKIEDSVQQMVSQGVTNLNLDPKILQIAQGEMGKLNTSLNDSFTALSTDLYKLATYNLSSIHALASTTDALAIRIDLLEMRIANLESASTTAATSTVITELTATSTMSSIGEWASSLTTTLTDGITTAIQSLGSSKALAAVLGVFDRIFAREVYTDTLCVGSVCVTQEQFLKMVQMSGATPQSSPEATTGTAVSGSQTSVSESPVLAPQSDTTATSTVVTIDSTPALTPESETTPSSEPAPTSEPASEPISDTTPSPDTAPATDTAPSSDAPAT